MTGNIISPLNTKPKLLSEMLIIISIISPHRKFTCINNKLHVHIYTTASATARGMKSPKVTVTLSKSEMISIKNSDCLNTVLMLCTECCMASSVHWQSMKLKTIST